MVSKLKASTSARTLYASMASKVATKLCSGVCDYALKMHGGYGYLREFGIKKYQISSGTN